MIFPRTRDTHTYKHTQTNKHKRDRQDLTNVNPFCVKVTGYGLALAGVAIEQDAAYWEWHVSMPEGKSDEIMFGVATKKDRSFFRALKESEGDGKSDTHKHTHMSWR